MRLLFLENTSFIVFLLQTSCIEFAFARGSYAIVNDDVMTSQDYTNGEHPKTTSQLESCKSSDSFSLSVFLNFLRDFFHCIRKAFVYFLILGRCFIFGWGAFSVANIENFDFFCLKSSNCYQMKPMFIEDPSIFYFFYN